ncbi:MAG: TonB-dependent receptor [Spongiibacteraceae bacterium]|jgi:iron complex outermembrane recepter protein|nr:TonB-dependent receptor [Spongiibacteraceae bacterium]
MNRRRTLIGTLALLGSTSLYANSPVLEEVIVTAQLRSQSLQDVPVSVSAMGGNKIQEAGIDKIENLQAYIPNFTMSETGIGTNIYIRGLGSGINQGFEQSVGMYFDGIYYGRAQLSRAPFLDLERVEVLRGPQNILYGKNSIAGAVSLHSRRPGEESEGKVSLLYEPDHGEEVVDLVLSGPLTDTVGVRFAGRYRQLDGYIENLTLNRDEPARDEVTARLLIDWAVSDRLQILTKLEAGKFDVTGRQVEVVTDVPSNSTNPLFAGRTYAEILNNTQIPGVLNIDADESVLNNFQDYKRSSNGDYSHNDTRNLTVKADYDLNGHVLTFITGFMAYEFEEVADVDFTGAEVFDALLQEEYSQFSQEFRWVSPVGDNFEYIAGGYFQKSDLDYFDSVRIDSTILPELLNVADAAAGGDLGDRPADGDVFGGAAGVGDAGEHLRKLRTPREFTTDTELWSIFFQGTWHWRHNLRATLGARLSYETKDGSRSIKLTNDGSQLDPQEVRTVLAKVLSVEEQDLEGSRSSTNISPLFTLQYEFDSTMLFATLSQGFKSGGFDARSNQSPAADDPAPHNPNYGDDPQEQFIGSFEFEEEEAITLEVGSKSTLWDGRADLNATAFITEYDDLQVSIFDGTLGFNVGNAGAARTMGIEVDGRVALTDSLTLSGALAVLDFEFTKFENGQCFQQQPDPDGDGLCDFTGKTNQYVADYSGNLSLAYENPLANGLTVRGAFDVVFSGEYNPTQDLDPRLLQDAYYKVNLRAAIADEAAGWEFALIGKNLTDEVIITYANSMSLANSVFGAIGHYAFIERPRNVAAQFTYRW